VLKGFRRLTDLLSDDAEDICVHRDNVTEEMIAKYAADHTIDSRLIKVSFIGETGDDLGGLTKDLFTSLWSDLLKKFFIGEAAMVPFMPMHEQMRKRRYYEAIGRILSHTASLLHYVPARLSRCTLLCLALDSSQITDDLLLADMRYKVLLSHDMLCPLSTIYQGILQSCQGNVRDFSQNQANVWRKNLPMLFCITQFNCLSIFLC